MSIIDSALVQIRQLHPYSPGKPIEELERELGINNAIKLASNENPLGCSPLARAALEKAGEHNELYPDANAYYLKQKLCQKLGIGDNQITIGNGSNDVLDLVARSFLDAGTEAIFSQYAFMVYAMVTQACGATARVAPASANNGDSSYGHDLDAMADLINDRTRVIFIANPNNPTGTWLRGDDLRAFIEAVPESIAVVVDEAYFEYVDLAQYPDTLQWLDRFDNLVVTRTFSKIYGLAGLRVGYSVSSPELCELFNRVRQPFNGNSLALAAAQAALDDDEFVERSRQCNSQGLLSMQHWFDRRGIEYIPSVGNFLTVRFGDNSSQVYQDLLQRGVIVRPVANYDMPEFLRISVGTEDQLQQLYRSLGEIL
ncbi:MAG: histidinol-phosphate transaminase [Gammaproteobacteria bacterium]|nr:MAG: histidinol-phosphate transaminase [Gammaproteobacteria bacterium]UCH39537.1 MAG: histidinol-phosphate transaminase [Gammaproteobacteria bacterium]